LESYGGVKGEVSKALGQYVDAEEKYLKKKQEKMGDDINESDIIYEDAPIAKIVSNLIRGAAEKSASDIHIEIDQKEISVRYRIDGIMQKSLVLPKNIHRAVVARIKILSRIKIDERRKPQDGRFSGKFLGRKIDFRVSTFPTYYGEKVVMRLLEQDRGALLIEELGFTKENLEKVKKMLSNSYGMILVCGPTGSGKTSTLYSLLNEINKKNLNVVSLENPIELNIPGVSQSQVRPEIDYTFSEGLRSILRQDPDIIMVGEIRDKETASLAIEASLTGHLVLSTIHTNTAADVPQRLVDMGIEPYLIGPTLIAAIGQRLIRKIIPEAKKEIDMDIGTKKFIEDKIKGLPENIRKTFLENNKMYKAQSIKNDEDGMAGRIAVFEVLEIDNELKRIIVTDPSSISIFEAARKKGYITFKEDGIIKAFNGITTFEEVMKL
jgi:type IV pilus assembly protein PilB